MTRHDDATSPIHFFLTHFFEELVERGPENVEKWTKGKGVDIFSKKVLGIPINQSLHWSFCFVLNPGGDEPFLLFMDALKAHNMSFVAEKIREYLHFMKTKQGIASDRFNSETMPVFAPRGE